MNRKRYPLAEIVLFYRLTAKFKIEGVWESWTLWGPHRTRVQERDYCSYWYCLSFWLLADAPQIKETNNSVRKLLLQYISGFYFSIVRWLDCLIHDWSFMKYVWSIAYFVNGNNLFSLWQKKKKKKKKNETESRIFTRHFIVYNVISKLKCFGNRIVKTYDLISIADFAG